MTTEWITSGAPPYAAWWPTSTSKPPVPGMERYWHGAERGWSAPCYEDDSEAVHTWAQFTNSESKTSEIAWRRPIASTRVFVPDIPRADARSSSAIKSTNPKDVIGVRKAPMSTVPANVLAEVGVAMLEGTCKYGRHNYRAVGVRASVYYDGTMRHLMSWWEGEDIDIHSEMSHITKAITSLVVLRDAMLQGKLTDDRPPRSVPFYPRLNALAAATLDKHSGTTPPPKHWTIADLTA